MNNNYPLAYASDLGELTLTEELLTYDGTPRTFTCVSDKGEHYLVTQSDESDENSEWLYLNDDSELLKEFFMGDTAKAFMDENAKVTKVTVFNDDRPSVTEKLDSKATKLEWFKD